jgi:hypothetical protein
MRKTVLAAAILSLAFITTSWAASDDTKSVNGQATSSEPLTGAGATQAGGANSEDQGGTGVKASAQGEGATNKDTQPRDTAPVVPE